MQIQNSYCFWKKYKHMEQYKENIKFNRSLRQQQSNIQLVLRKNNQHITLTKDNFIRFFSFIDDQNLDCYIQDINYFYPQKHILHVFLYFILNVGKQVIKDPIYEETCRLQVAGFYIKKKMNIQVYQYALICSRILTTKIQFCLHVLYFLVYGRYASEPYIQSICYSKQFKHRRTLKMKISKPFRDNKSKNGSITFKSIIDKDYELKKFQKELGEALRINSNQKVQLQKPKSLRKNLDLHKPLKKPEQNFTKINQTNINNVGVLTTKIQNRQNSALVQTISGVIPKNASKLTRKKNFQDISVDWINQCSQLNKSQQGQKQQQIQNFQKEFSKKTANNFYSITSSLRNSSRILDKIRHKQFKIPVILNKKLIKGNRRASSKNVLDLQQQLQLLQKKNLQEYKNLLSKKNLDDSDQQSSQQQNHQPMKNLLRNRDLELENIDSDNINIFQKFLSLNKRPILRTARYKQQYKGFLDNLIFNFQFQEDYTM